MPGWSPVPVAILVRESANFVRGRKLQRRTRWRPSPTCWERALWSKCGYSRRRSLPTDPLSVGVSCRRQRRQKGATPGAHIRRRARPKSKSPRRVPTRQAFASPRAHMATGSIKSCGRAAPLDEEASALGGPTGHSAAQPTNQSISAQPAHVRSRSAMSHNFAWRARLTT